MPGRKRTELEHAILYIHWERGEIACPWKNEREFKRHAPSAELRREAEHVLSHNISSHGQGKLG